ncbi:MAG TPA: hypothetical protein VJ385_09835 [Fibrobacteria bacterium]|nr:hypothetical protein [Fibrobacteria bacterium]
MQFYPSKETRSRSALPVALLFAGALAALALAACDKAETTSPAADPNAKITLTKPVGGETFRFGDSLRIRWTVKDDPAGPIQAVDVLLSPDSGKTWVHLPYGPAGLKGSIKPDSPYWNNFSWKVTDSLYVPEKDASVKLGNTHCLVRVKDYTSEAASNRSTTASYISIIP